MLINKAEYETMYHTENELWWYKILHLKVLQTIKKEFGTNKEISILDAGCGTGGLLDRLKKEGYHNLKGFDFSKDAVNLCIKRGLDVGQFSLLQVPNQTTHKVFDVVICNDVFYQFDDQELKLAIENLSYQIKPNGVLISNNQAFKAFRGTHDIAVGSKRRFKLKDFDSIIEKEQFPLKVLNHNYWSLMLSPLIFIVRLKQRIQLRLGMIDLNHIKSDVSLPPKLINNLFYKIVKFEDSFLPKKVFGSSLFISCRKDS